ncbi:hypothetical protein ILUMI_17703 [Ignelater luminosus]|uniref:Reverse transcriptase n=1 Tax=Ignelater luminosus TaxID=2038154 RepID=A0A8K0CL89_IGNLU|nr:hypothetical protein ILUMI_17703 [Ignelater luminosus]
MGKLESIWQALKQSLVTTLEELPQDDQITFRQPWLSAETRHLITESRSIKARGLDTSINRELYQSLKCEVQIATRRNKNSYLMNICSEIQNHAVNNNSKDPFMKIRSITQKFKPRHWAIKGQNCLNTELDKIASIWKDYCIRAPMLLSETWGITRKNRAYLEEVQVAIKKLREGKAAGLDKISAEVLQVLDNRGQKIMHTLCQKIWKTGLWPEDWSTA